MVFLKALSNMKKQVGKNLYFEVILIYLQLLGTYIFHSQNTSCITKKNQVLWCFPKFNILLVGTHIKLNVVKLNCEWF